MLILSGPLGGETLKVNLVSSLVFCRGSMKRQIDKLNYSKIGRPWVSICEEPLIILIGGKDLTQTVSTHRKIEQQKLK